MRRAARVLPAAVLLLAATVRAEARVDLPPRDDRTVYDLAGIVSAEDRDTMERSHRDLRDKTGVSISVVTFPSLEGEPLEEVLGRAGPEWGLGREDGDLGVVVALSMGEHGILIATGKGAETFLPDTRVNTVIGRIMIPRLQMHDPSHALLHASNALSAAASQWYGKPASAPAATTDAHRLPARGWAPSLVVVMFFAALALRPLTQRLFARTAPQ